MGFRVVGVDHSSKKDLVMSSGAEHFIGIDSSPDVVESVKGATEGLGVHAVVVVTGTSHSAKHVSSLEISVVEQS